MMEATKEFIRVVDDFVVMRWHVNSRSSDEVIEAQFERLKQWQKLLPHVVREMQDAGGDGKCVTKLDAMVYSGDLRIGSPARISEYWLDCKAELRRTLMLAKDRKPPVRKTLTVAELARILKVSTDTIDRMVERGELPQPHLPTGKKKGKVFFEDEVTQSSAE